MRVCVAELDQTLHGMLSFESVKNVTIGFG